MKISVSLPPDFLAKLDAYRMTFERVADNQEKIATLHEENGRLLAELSGKLSAAEWKLVALGQVAEPAPLSQGLAPAS